MSDKALPNWVKVSKKGLMRQKMQFKMLKEILYKLDHRLIQTLIQDIVHGNITHEEALNKMADIDYNFTKITEKKVLTQTKLKW